MQTTQLLPVFDFEGHNFKDYNDLVDHVEKHSIDNLPQLELPITHRFAPGQYSREMFAPAGTVLTSKIHAHTHFFFLMQGKILVMEESGSRLISAPYHGISEAGARRIGLVLEHVVWTTVHTTDLVEDKEYSEEEMRSLAERIESEVTVQRTNKLLEV